MWYGVETAFIDGELFGSRCLFKKGSKSPVGHCYAPKYEQPGNSVEKQFDNRIELHCDWFESEELAERFCNGEITYIHYYHAWYDSSINSTFRRYCKREIAEVDFENYFPYRGITKDIVLDSRPYWAS